MSEEQDERQQPLDDMPLQDIELAEQQAEDVVGGSKPPSGPGPQPIPYPN